MSRKLPITPISQIKGCFRMLTLRAREVQAVRKRDGNSCVKCGKKHSVAKGKEVKVQVHHKVRPNWDRIISAVREELLDPNKMECLCEEHHEQHHIENNDGFKRS